MLLDRREFSDSQSIPHHVLFLLENCSLSFLATADKECKPEQSLMFFTWCPQDQVVIFVTPKEVKYRNMTENSNICVLLHSFEGLASTVAAFDGVAQTANGEEDRRYRELHSVKHPKYASAFQGEDKAVVYFEINKARLVTVKGEICYWVNPLNAEALNN
ncbi:pyridoxamine 5'-phosphate oxidase [Acrasis kona]|uniref:Pyridoxamine 5'-phosphate oxidase n=1 Tax=Acrasis kona TaxID=1008807 RepID=A0AAW2ZJM6_9EUKA